MLDIAIEAAKKAGDLAYRYFKTQSASWRITYKPDKSPVTRADIEAEKLIRKIISKKFPNHGIIGEELPPINPKAKYQWIIDPIDGTRDFARNIPLWCTLLAVTDKQKPIIGICYFPTRNELFVAQKGKGAFLNNKKVHVSKTKLSKAYISVTPALYFADHNKVNHLIKLCQKTGTSRYLSSLAYSYLWQGKCDAYISAKGGIWDFIAPAIITQEAGGKFSDFDGNYRFDSNCAVMTNGVIHNQVLKILNSQ